MTAQSLKDRVEKRLKAAGQPKRRRADRYSKPFRSQPFRSKPKPEGYIFGRPTRFRPEYCQLVIERMAQGVSLTAFAGSIGIARSAVYVWMGKHADFRDAVSRARPARALWLERKLLRSWGSRDGAETMATLWALRNAAPDEWCDVKRREYSHNVKIETLTDAQLYAIAARLDR